MSAKIQNLSFISEIRKVYDYNGHSVALLSEESYKEFEYRNKI
jgi:hypothetical protein